MRMWKLEIVENLPNVVSSYVCCDGVCGSETFAEMKV